MEKVKEKIELVGSVCVEKDVKKKIQQVGVRGMDIEKAKEFGFFNRISNLLCVTHSAICAAYKVYGIADAMLSEFGARRNDIAKTMNDYDKAVEKMLNFWTSYYSKGSAGEEVNEESENLFHHIMEWSQLPEEWHLGDEQRVKTKNDVAIKVNIDNKTLYFHKTTIKTEMVVKETESWCVTRFDTKEHRQVSVEENMDKASAMMVAKRLSSEDTENIYTASVVQDVAERSTVVIPFKAYKDNNTIGSIKNIERI